MYPEMLAAPMREELTSVGFKQLMNADEVQSVLNKKQGTQLLVINSVCGCAAGTARPGVCKSLENGKNPSELITVFAGMEADAVTKAREFLLSYPPSSPAIALFKDGELVHMIERHNIEGRSAQMIADNLQAAYDEFC
ncbi:MAG: BrxA/BrxB family bacilliredoxin [Bacteroidetes bacterium]|nr:BrxA/BrxB family bacilliredoxin [Bacteroidota bacterium]